VPHVVERLKSYSSNGLCSIHLSGRISHERNARFGKKKKWPVNRVAEFRTRHILLLLFDILLCVICAVNVYYNAYRYNIVLKKGNFRQPWININERDWFGPLNFKSWTYRHIYIYFLYGKTVWIFDNILDKILSKILDNRHVDVYTYTHTYKTEYILHT